MRFDRKTRIMVSVMLGLAWARLAQAQPAVATHRSLTLDGARGLSAAAQKVAQARHTTGAVAVVDQGGNLIALDRIDGTTDRAAHYRMRLAGPGAAGAARP